MKLLKNTRRRIVYETKYKDFEDDHVKSRNGELSFYKTRFQIEDDCYLWLKLRTNNMQTKYKSQFNIKQGRAEILDGDWYLIKQYSPDAKDNIKNREDYVVFKDYLAFNILDRDNERFPVPVLDRLKETIIGKQKLGSKDTGGHNWSTYGIGRYFKAELEIEDINEGINKLGGHIPSENNKKLQIDIAKKDNGIYWLVASYFVPKHLTKEIADIGAGLTNSSIGFIGAKTRDVNDKDGKFLYREYVITDVLEAVEGSLVGVESQRGATSKDFVPNAIPPENEDKIKTVETNNMEVKIKLDAINVEKSVNSESLEEDVKALQKSIEEEVSKTIESLTTEIDTLKETNKTLEADKEKAIKKIDPYHAEMVEDTIKYGRLSEMINDENVEERQKLFEKMTFDELKERRDTFKEVHNKLHPPKGETETNNGTEIKENKEIDHAPDSAFQIGV